MTGDKIKQVPPTKHHLSVATACAATSNSALPKIEGKLSRIDAVPGPTLRAVVIGGGFIGLEMVENLVHRDFEMTLVEMLDQVLAPLDREHARILLQHGFQARNLSGGFLSRAVSAEHFGKETPRCVPPTP